jgi:type 1 glutamine amidotransferase
VLFFTKSSGFEHSVIQRKGDAPSFAEGILAKLGPKHGIEFTFSKDGSLFTGKYLAGFDAYAFYTTGDLTVSGSDQQPPMTPAGKVALLKAIENGKGFVGIHSATDTFHTPEPADATQYRNDGAEADPYIQMIGAEFIIHGKQQNSTLRVTDRKLRGIPGTNVALLEEWYTFKNFAKDLDVMLVQETAGMEGTPYQRPPYPVTWARLHGRGRVFYTSLGHREDVWMSPLFEGILFGGIDWAVRNADAQIAPNIDTVTPGCSQLPPK